MIKKRRRYYDIGYITDIGNKRTLNQDRVCCLSDGKIALIAAADGMGGLNDGEKASRMAVEHFEKWWQENANKIKKMSESDIELSIVDTIDRINSDIVAFSKKIGEKAGTTLTMLLICEKRCFYAYSGDTRLYLLRGGNVQQLTQDENLYAYFESIGEEDNPPRNKSILMSYLGKGKNLAINFNTVDVSKKDIFALCTDGLYNYFDLYKKENADIIYNNSAEKAAEEIKDYVKTQKASDNLTLIILKCR